VESSISQNFCFCKHFSADWSSIQKAMQQQTIAKVLIGLGILLVLLGLIYFFFGDWFRWIGRLPGDIRIERENFRFYFPITTMILLSVLLTLIFSLIRRFL